MAEQSKTTLKTYFETGDTPTEAQFIDLIDSIGLQSAVDVLSAGLGLHSPTSATGTTITFDKYSKVYNEATPSNSATVTLDFNDALFGACAAFFSDGTEVTTITSSKTVIQGGTQETGQTGVLFFLNLTDTVVANWVPSAAGASTPQLTTPTIALVAGNAELDYTISSQDANAVNGVMQISTDQATWYNVTSGEYDGLVATTTGTITEINSSALTNGTLYYVRFKNTASGYTDSAYASDSETPAATGTPLTLSLGANMTNPSSEVYSHVTAGGGADVTAHTTTTYSGAFDVSILVEDATKSYRQIIGMDIDDAGDYNDVPNAMAAVIQVGPSGGSWAKYETGDTNYVAITAPAQPANWTAGDKIRLVRDGSNNVKAYYNSTELHDFGTIAGAYYIAVGFSLFASTPAGTYEIVQPRVIL